MEVGTVVYTIENRKIREYTLTQRNTIETIAGKKDEYFFTEKGTSFITKTAKKDLLADNIDIFTSKEEVNKIYSLIQKYI